MSNSHIPRQPADAEKKELAQLVAEFKSNSPTAEDINDELEYIEGTCIAVFDDYITDGPGFFGKVMIVVWGGSPEYYEMYLWRTAHVGENKKLVKVPIADEFKD